MNKKAVTESVLILMILFIVFTFFMLVFIMSGKEKAEEQILTRENCGATVDRMDRYNTLHVPTSDRGLKCPETLVTVAKEKDDENYQLIADGYYNCAKQFRQGKVRLFNDNGVHCNVCYIFDIQTDNPLKELGTYLDDHNVPEGTEVSYLEYAQGFASKGAPNVLKDFDTELIVKNLDTGMDETVDLKEKLGLDNAELTPGEQYALVFVYARGLENFDRIINHLTLQTPSGKAGAAVGGLSFAAFTGGSIGVSAGVVSTLSVLGIASGPAGWIIIGTGVGLGTLAFAGAEALSLHFSPSDPPEYLSLFRFVDWDKDTSKDVFTKKLGCDFFE
ncbi:hypothetical protein CMO88_01865 [Candidatus Woesearchaeota archaeon]|nr:hypothetical protein [Candidatus Woesearchaeota archaeon]